MRVNTHICTPTRTPTLTHAHAQAWAHTHTPRHAFMGERKRCVGEKERESKLEGDKLVWITLAINKNVWLSRN